MSTAAARFLRTLAACAVAGSLSASTAGAATLAISTFDVDDEGWRVTHGRNGTPVFDVLYESSGGNPGGRIRQIGVLNLGFWTAPSKFLGDVSSAYGGLLEFDLLIPPAGGGLNSGFDVLLAGSGISLLLDLGDSVVSGNAWQSFEVPLLPSAGWHVDSLSGPLATGTQLFSVLSDLTALRIRQEWAAGPDNSSLDNVVLSTPASPVPVPEFAGAPWLACAAGGVAVARRRLRR